MEEADEIVGSRVVSMTLIPVVETVGLDQDHPQGQRRNEEEKLAARADQIDILSARKESRGDLECHHQPGDVGCKQDSTDEPPAPQVHGSVKQLPPADEGLQFRRRCPCTCQHRRRPLS